MTSTNRYLALSAVILLAVVPGLSGCNTGPDSGLSPDEKWEESAHADENARAFTHWSDDGSDEIPSECARCHSTDGFLDFLGADGSEPGQVSAAAVGTTIECDACHNEISEQDGSAIMPSGQELVGLGRNAACVACHQGRTAKADVNAAVSGLPDDRVAPGLSFIDIHSNAAGSFQLGTGAQGAFEYNGKAYLGRHDHALGIEGCISCHDPHALTVEADRCAACHLEVKSAGDFLGIRVTDLDFDGDGNVSDGLADEIDTLHRELLTAMQDYAVATEGCARIVYETGPPFFVDDTGRAYETWTPRLLKAAYNYQFVALGSGGYVHHGKYAIQLLYDSLADLGVKMRGLTRP